MELTGVENPQCASTRQSFFLFLRLNIFLFTTLLSTLTATQSSNNDDAQSPTPTSLPPPSPTTSAPNPKIQIASTARPPRIKIPPLATNILPCLRNYGSWVLSDTKLLTAGLIDTSIVENLWQTYAKTLQYLSTLIIDRDFPAVTYVLPEDEETIGFLPFTQDTRNKHRYYYCFSHYNHYLTATVTVAGTSEEPHHTMKGDERKGEEKEKKEKEKKRISDRGVKRQHSTIENVQRIRDFLEDAREVLKEERVPVRMWKQQSAAHHGGDSGGGGYVGGGRTIGVTFGLGSQPLLRKKRQGL